MSNIDQYIKAATRENTRKSYQSAIRHFEIEWGGFLPATPESVGRYLADYAGTLSANTMRQRMAALSQWHCSQGFPDPTKSQLVRKVLKGIQVTHPMKEKQAKPLQIEELDCIVAELQFKIELAEKNNDKKLLFQSARDKLLLLLGFWRGFRSDELVNLRIENVDAVANVGMTCYLARSKADHANKGRIFKTPALTKLCPVEAYLNWVNIAQLESGPVFRSIDRWGHVSERPLNSDSLTPILRSILSNAGISSVTQYSGHSMRRGFANWATANGWELKTLMQYVGWKNINSAIRYVDPLDSMLKQKIDDSLKSKL